MFIGCKYGERGPEKRLSWNSLSYGIFEWSSTHSYSLSRFPQKYWTAQMPSESFCLGLCVSARVHCNLFSRLFGHSSRTWIPRNTFWLGLEVLTSRPFVYRDRSRDGSSPPSRSVECKWTGQNLWYRLKNQRRVVRRHFWDVVSWPWESALGPIGDLNYWSQYILCNLPPCRCHS